MLVSFSFEVQYLVSDGHWMDGGMDGENVGPVQQAGRLLAEV